MCFAVQASLAHPAHTQNYIFDSILSIFGKGIAENIVVMVTFADGKTSPVLEAVKVSDIPCSTDQSGEPLHFKFNNSALFATNNKSEEDEDSDCENFDQMFWKLGFSSMKTILHIPRYNENPELVSDTGGPETATAARIACGRPPAPNQCWSDNTG